MALDIVLMYGPRGGRFLMSELPLYLLDQGRTGDDEGPAVVEGNAEVHLREGSSQFNFAEM